MQIFASYFYNIPELKILDIKKIMDNIGMVYQFESGVVFNNDTGHSCSYMKRCWISDVTRSSGSFCSVYGFLWVVVLWSWDANLFVRVQRNQTSISIECPEENRPSSIIQHTEISYNWTRFRQIFSRSLHFILSMLFVVPCTKP